MAATVSCDISTHEITRQMVYIHVKALCNFSWLQFTILERFEGLQRLGLVESIISDKVFWTIKDA